MVPATQGVPGYFVWQAPGQPTVIHLSIDVVERMGTEIMRGFGLVPKRGAEVGGILIGGIERGDISIIRIDDFEAVPCTYARGPSYLLTEPERLVFDETCRRRSAEMVGYYRSHTRDGLALQQEDLQLLDRHFPSPAQVALLVKPFGTKPAMAGFFIRENNVFPAVTPLEFPFRRWELTGEEPPRRAPIQERKRKEREPVAPVPIEQKEKKVAAPPPQVAPQPYFRIFSMEPEQPPKEPPEQRGRKSRTGLWMVATFVFLLLGVLLGYEASRITAPRRASELAMSLAVERTGENLTVRWNPESLPVRSASNGVLEIDDGGESKRVELDRSNLSSGSMVYRNTSGMLRLRLVVNVSSGVRVTEELDWPR